jgi:hypothetical protein
VTANAVFEKPAGCAKSMREQCRKNEREKRDGQSNHTYRTFERKSDAHSDPCRQADWAGIIRGPGVIRVGQKCERQCRDKANLGKLVGPGAEHAKVHPKINPVVDGQKAKQTKILEYLTFATVPRFADILPHIESIVSAISGVRQDAERIRQMLLKSSALATSSIIGFRGFSAGHAQ